jgi:putative ABC transport system permease protein
VVLSIFIGVFATGIINGARSIVVDELDRSYSTTNPAHITINFSDDDSFTDDLLNVIEGIDGVEYAEGRSRTSVDLYVGNDTWDDFNLTAIPDYEDMHVKLLGYESGATEPGDKEVLMERSSMEELQASIGDTLIIENSGGNHKFIKIVGVVHDLSIQPTSMSGNYYGYITPETMEWLGKSREYTEMLIRVAKDAPTESANPTQTRMGSSAGGGHGGRGMGGRPPGMSGASDSLERPNNRQITVVTEAVSAKIEKSDRVARIPRFFGGGSVTDHWATTFISNLSSIMGALGVMALFLSGFLVTNTISALIVQQTKQIGIMKAIGARSRQIIGMYIILVFCFGVIAMLIAIPATLYVTDLFVSLIANYYNFDLSGATFPRDILYLQAFASIGVPIIASIIPVFNGTRVTVLQAINSEGIEATKKVKKAKKGKKAKQAKKEKKGTQATQDPQKLSWKERTNTLLSRVFNRPLVLSLRNTFRRKVRVSLTLLTLTVGGFIFIGIFTIRTSLITTLQELLDGEIKFDASLMLNGEYRDYHILDNLYRVPGIAVAEAWSRGGATRVYENDWESDNISLTGLPYDSQLIDPTLVAGRWLVAGDQSAIVLTVGVLEDDPDITVNKEIVLNINDKKSTWTVVGIVTSVGDSREGYVTYEHLTRVLGSVGKTNTFRIKYDDPLPYDQAIIQETMTDLLERQSIEVGRIFSKAELMEMLMERFNFIVNALLVMALLMALVGGLGLTGTMSLNVIERTREIGIMRAIGASNKMILQIFLAEGLIIGILSWFLGTTLSLPISKLLSDALGSLFFRMPLNFHFAYDGVGIWLMISFVLALLASFLPAWNATRMSVREVLMNE